MKTLQKTGADGVVHLIPSIHVTFTARELAWLIDGMDALVSPPVRIKRALSRALLDLSSRES